MLLIAMGNVQTSPSGKGKSGETKEVVACYQQSPGDLFRELDVEKKGYLTLNELLVEKASAPSHSLPALYFCDVEKDGRITEEEFLMLVQFCLQERKKVKSVLLKDKGFRELIQRASAAGVKGSSPNCRTSFRRLSSFRDVRSVYSRPPEHGNLMKNISTVRPPHHPDLSSPSSQMDLSPGKLTRNDSMPGCSENVDFESTVSTSHHRTHTTDQVIPKKALEMYIPDLPHSIAEEAPPFQEKSSLYTNDHSPLKVSGYDSENSGCDDQSNNSSACTRSTDSDTETEEEEREDENESARRNHCRTISMVSSKLEFTPNGTICTKMTAPSTDVLTCEKLEPGSITALDAAVVENVMRTHISKLADLLHSETARIQFMQWLWELADYKGHNSVALIELKKFFAALSEDGIDVEELAFYKTPGVPLEKRILNEFDIKHRGYLTRSEFLSLADLITREYEFWESRHLERIGNYELGRTIGLGTSGVVRAAFNMETREKFAMKIIKKGFLSDLSRLDTEIQAMMLTKHSNIVNLIEVMESQDSTFLVLELCGGGSLIDMVRIYPEEKMPEDTARYYVRELFEALAYCHASGICHRDVRAENMLLDNNGSLKLTDFGHSGLYVPGWDVFNSNLVGSIFNLSPEQVTGQPYSGEKIDVWSAGVAMYCLLVGRPPFCDADTNRLVHAIVSGSFSIPETVSREAADLMRCAIQVSATARPSMAELLHHPWFFSGPEVAPIMNVVNIVVDRFFARRPDLAEMVIAKTIHHSNIHFHLGDTKDPTACQSKVNGKDWALNCHCPKNDIKFSVSLFTHDPTSGAYSSIAAVPKDPSRNPSRSSPEIDDNSTPLPVYAGDALCARPKNDGVTNTSYNDNEGLSEDSIVQDVAPNDGSPKRQNEFKLSRSRSLDENLEGLLNVTRSATFDVFPYQRTMPQRQKPSTTPDSLQRKAVDDTSLYMSRRAAARATRNPWQQLGSNGSRLNEHSDKANHSNSTDPTESPNHSQILRAGDGIKKTLSVHPSKASMFLTSNMHDKLNVGRQSQRTKKKMKAENPISSRNGLKQTPGSSRPPRVPTALPTNRTTRVTLGSSKRSHSESWSCFDLIDEKSDDSDESDFQPFLEIRLNNGQSGLFLKICRKLKTICETELAATAEFHKKKRARNSPVMKRVNSVSMMRSIYTPI